MKLKSCAFNMDTVCVERRYEDGSMIAIDTFAVENEIVKKWNQQAEMDYLLYKDPATYADLILNGDPEQYLKAVIEYRLLDS